MSDDRKSTRLSRRELLAKWVRLGAVVVLGGGLVPVLAKSLRGDTVWQLDPDICRQCGNCSTKCVLTPSAVKCVHAYDVCGYCDLCSGYLRPNAVDISTAAESRQCPTGAIKRTFIEDPYYEYAIDESLCIACGKCVKRCSAFGNGSLYLQVRHDRCVNCNHCSIARNCPTGAFRRVALDQLYTLKGKRRDATP